jgi:hypothetical protein
LSSYPFARFPSYITAGAYFVSNDSLLDLYTTSQFIPRFIFDDVYLGIIALKIGLNPKHSDQFVYWERNYDRTGFQKIIAAHGFKDPSLMQLAYRDYMNNQI